MSNKSINSGETLTVTATGTLAVSGAVTQGIRNEGTISNAGTITVNNSQTYGVYNTGTFNNSGRLDIGNTATTGAYGFFIVNSGGSPGVLNNLSGGIINIDRSTSNGMNFLGNNAIFTNEGTLNVGSIGGATAMPRGINYEYQYTCTVLNKSTGTINIDNTSDSGIKIWEGIITNEGIIKIGANSSAGDYGIISYGTIANASGALLNIDNVSRSGLHLITGAGSNAGTINIGANASIGTQGLYTQVTYDNTGVINIDNTPTGVSVNTGTFNNTGTVTIGGINSVATLVGGNSPFNNNLNGTLKGTGSISAGGFVNNGGTISPGYSPGIQTFTFGEDFTNSIIEIEVNGSTTAGTDFDQIVVNGAATLGGTLNLTINSTPTDVVTIIDATSLSGTFATVNGSLPAGLMLQYDFPNAGEVSLVGCDLAISTQPTNQEVCDGEDVTFSIAGTSSAGGLTYQWQKIADNSQTPWSRYDNTTSGFPSNNQINGIFVNGSTTYACTHGGGLGVFDGTSWTSVTTSNSSIPSDIMYDAVEYDGKLHVATTQGTGVYDGTNWTVINNSTSGYPPSPYTQAIFTADGMLYVGTLGGIGIYDGTSWSYADANTSGFPQYAFPYTSNITSITKLNGVVYAGTARSGLAVYDGTSWSTIDNNTTGFPVSNNVEVVYASNGKLYVGTQNGLGIYDGSTWTTVDDSTTGFSGSYVSGLYEADGKLYVGMGSGQGMNIYDGSSWTNLLASDFGLTGSIRVYDIHIEGGTTTLATLGGVVISPTAPTPTNITETTATTASYTFTPQTGDENYTYQVLVTDANGCTVTSNPVSFGAAAPENCCDLAISTQPTNQEVCDGEDVTFSVAGTSSAGGLSYQWQQVCPSASSDWVNIGNNTTTGFPSSNQINDVYYADGLLYVGSHGGGLGVYDGTSWTTFNSSTPGFPNMDAVYSIMKGDDGKLYISTGTAGGLGIYDGTTWTNIPIWGGPTGFASVTIQDLYVSGGNIYLASWGINIFDGTSWTAIPPTTAGFPGTYAHSITESNGIVYVGTDGGLGIYDGTTWTTVDSNTPGFPGDKVESVEVANGKVYAGTPNGLAIYDGTTWTTVDNTTPGFSNGNSVREVYIEGDKVYVATNMLNVYDGTSWSSEIVTSHNPNSIHVDNGNIYMGTLQGVAIPPTDVVVDISTGGTSASYTFTPQAGDESCTYQVVITDANNCEVTSNAVSFSDAAPENCCDLAITTQPTNQEVCDGEDVTFSVAGTSSAGGLTYQWQKIADNSQTPWTQFDNTTTGFPSNNQINGIFVNGGTTYACSHGGGLGVFDGTSWTSMTTSNSSIPSNTMYDAVEYDGKLHVATTQGTGVYDGTNWSVITTSTSGYPRSSYTQAIFTADGILYVGTLGGIGIFDGTTWFYADANTAGFPQYASPYTSNITSIGKLGNVVYAGTARSGLAVYDGTNWSTIDNTTTGFPTSNNVESVYAANGKLYVGTQNGLGVLDGSTWTTIDDNTTGFVGNNVEAIYEADGKIYVGTSQGLNIYDGSSWTNLRGTDIGLSNNSLYVRDIQIVGGTTYMGILGGVVISPTAPTPVDITVNTATSASYTFTPQTGDESCTYQVVITDANNCEVTSNAVSFSDAAPENCCDLAISTPPTNQTVCAGEDVTFSVAGTSSAGGLTYQWQQLCESEPAWDLIASSTTTGFPGDRILDVKVDGANIYVGSISTGFGIFDGTSWTTVTSATTGFPASNRVNTIEKLGNNIYVGTTNGLGVFDGTSWTTITTATTNFPANHVYDLNVDNGILYLSAAGGVGVYDGTSWTKYDTSTPGFPSSPFVNKIYAANGIIYAATQAGLGIYDGTSWTTVDSNTSGFPSDDRVQSVYYADGKIYAGTYAGGIGIYDGTSWTTSNTTNTTGLPSGWFWDIYTIGNQIIAAGQGVLGIYDGTSWSSACGMPANAPCTNPYGIDASATTLYVGTSQGLAYTSLSGAAAPIVDATSATYTFTPTTADIACTYQVVVTDANNCEVTSNAVSITLDSGSGCNPSNNPGASLSFSSTIGNEQVLVPDAASLDLSSAVSIEAWINPSTASTGYQIYAMKASSGGWGSGYGLLANSNGTLFFSPTGWFAHGYLNPSYVLPADTWTHVAATYDGTNTVIYINGVSTYTKTETTQGTIPQNNFELGIGTDYGVPSYSFDGQMDEVRIWNRAISAQEVTDHINCEITGAMNGLVANYHFNQGVAGGDNTNPAVNTLIDDSGNGNNGTLTNFALTGTASNWVATGGVTSGNSCGNSNACDPNALTINDTPIAANTYHTAQTITSSGTVAASTTVIFKAAQSITLQSGFHAIAGSEFSAVIEACPATLVESETAKVIDQPSTQLATTSEIVGTPSVKVFPNPTTYRASIDLTLPVAETVQLDLFDLSGKRVANLVKDVILPAGIHHFDWQCEQVDAGMYLIVLNGQVVSKLAVIR